METRPLVVIVGPTASGKTSLAIDIAKKIDGEIICADSRTVYKYMDIGTAKPTDEEKGDVPHWGLDIVEPDERFTVADFKDYTQQKIAEIRSRGRTPILVGGTGLYVDAIIFDYEFGPPADTELRARLETMTLEQLHKYCLDNNIVLPENHKNKRYVIRAIEQKSINTKRRTDPINNTVIVGIATDREELNKKIELRAEDIFANNVVDEAKGLAARFGWNHESMTGNIYPLCRMYLDGEISLDEAKQRFIVLDRRLAKRQMRWLRRNPHIKWLSRTEAAEYLDSSLASEH